MKNKIFIAVVNFAIIITFLSCKKKEVIVEKEKIVYVDSTRQPTPVESGIVELIFEPVIDGAAYTMSTSFNTPIGENFKVTDFKFYLSGIAMVTESSKEFKAIAYPGDLEQIGVYLANFTTPNFNNGNGQNSHKLRFKAQVGEYSDIRFRFEVPSEYNLANMATNPYPLNASNGMYWSWNSGYKFLVVNGTSTNVAGSGAIHLSLGADKNCVFNFRSLVLAPNLPKISVQKDKTTQIRFTFNLMDMLRNTDGTLYSFNSSNPSISNSQVHGGANSNVIRANVQQALELKSFTNPQ